MINAQTSPEKIITVTVKGDEEGLLAEYTAIVSDLIELMVLDGGYAVEDAIKELTKHTVAGYRHGRRAVEGDDKRN